mmetsp:Transcript_24234/g.67535  ORF Transcript_24234/g.67535 Transcript_24234/m.67535 type:complete len:228 (+) Transcript_24234:175-858(+)
MAWSLCAVHASRIPQRGTIESLCRMDTFSFGACQLLECGDLLSLHSAALHLVLELGDVADAREEVRLATSVGIKCREPAIPLLLRRICLLEIADDRESLGGEESVVDDAVIPPTIGRSRDVVGRFGLQTGALVEIELVPLDVVELKGIALKDAANATSLHPEQRSEQQVEAPTHDPDHRGGSIQCVGWMIPHDQRTQRSDRHGQRVARVDHDVLLHPSLHGRHRPQR